MASNAYDLVSTSHLASALKIGYTGLFAGTTFNNHPLFGMIRKVQEDNKTISQSIYYSGAANIGATYAQAIGQTSTSKGVEFAIKTQDLYIAYALKDKEALAAAQKGKGSYVAAVAHEVNMALKTFGNTISHQLFRSASGYLGQTSAVSTTTVTFASKYDVSNIEVGMTLIASANADGSSPRNSGQEVTVSAVNHRTGVVTISASISGFVAGDYMFISTVEDSAMSGLIDWIPSVAARSGGIAALHGVTRTPNEVMLGGIAVDGSGKSLEESLLEVESELLRFGSSPEVFIMNPGDWLNLNIELSSKEIINKDASGLTASGKMGVNIGYQAWMVGGTGMKIVLDPACPKGFGFALDLSTLKLCHLGPALFSQWDFDGAQWDRTSTGKIQGVHAMFANLVCEQPSANAIVTLRG